MKKIGLFFATVVMIMLFALSASAATEGYYTYEIENGEAIITDVDVSISGDIDIPKSLGGYSVTTIGYGAFSECDSLTSITIHDNITKIENYAFSNCEKLTCITIPNSVATIGYGAFVNSFSLENIIVEENNGNYCSIDGVLFDKDKKILIQYPFANERTSYSIPDGVTTIKSNAFYSRGNLVNITIPSSITTIEDSCFEGCGSLANIMVDEDNKNYSSLDGVLFDKNKEILIRYPIGNKRTSYLIPDSVITIGNLAFADCHNLTGVIIPDSVATISDYAFFNCEGLTSVTLPISVTSIGTEAFVINSLTSIVVAAGNNCYCSIDGVLFNKDKKTLIQYPAGNKNTSYLIPEGVITIGNAAFRFCNNIKSVTIPDSVTTIRSHGFYQCYRLASVIIPNSVITIGNYAFCDCYSLTNIIIPSSVTTIGHDAFFKCDNLADVYYCGTGKQWKNIRVEFGGSGLSNTTIIHFEYCLERPDNRHSYVSEITTQPTHSSEGAKTFACDCGETYNEPIEKIPHSYNEVVTAPTCTERGYTTYTCECGDSYINDYIDEKGHSHTSTITTEPTHLTEGVMTYICGCGDSYTEPVAKIPHFYNKVVTAPTCTEKGYTTYICECGESYVADEVSAKGHNYTSTVTTQTTHLKEGVETFTCACGDTYTKSISKLKEHTYTEQITKEPTHKEEGVKTFTCECGDSYTNTIEKIPHSYSKVVTAPTCTSKGYTTYTCECGYSYVGDYVGTKSHSYISTITRPATHLTEGVRTYTCSVCGDSYPEAIAKTKEHSYVILNIVEPTCETEGYTVYVCECGHSYNGDKTSATGHNYNGDNCTICGESKADNCDCNCHKSGFSGLIWKILRFFYKLFGTNKTCSCGVAHY